MAYLPSLPENAVLLDIFRRYPETSAPLLSLHEVVMRGASPLTVGERELIAAYVSGVNACGYCHGIHSATAEAFGISAGEVDVRMRPVLAYVEKLTRTPAAITRVDVDAVYAAGWSEQALHDAIMVCAVFNFMNRVVDGHGIAATPDTYAESGQRLHDIGYAGLLRLIQQG
ncbi:carboxymuconolactone decarboxylase family protein [Actinokineospora inagensis]|uniref:carboxymuconolactone decarboxylase family protein n=1 Tax=Actinokineospora inagensis TaxID=103730 RepID=UPI000403EAB9|nr:carboxymuconolactone decarboxylase family protein [Actinokineospora inagensis]